MIETAYDIRGGRVSEGRPRRKKVIDLETQATPKEVKRVLDWQREVATSINHSPSPPPSLPHSPERPIESTGHEIVTVHERESPLAGRLSRRAESYPPVSQLGFPAAQAQRDIRGGSEGRVLRREKTVEVYRRPGRESPEDGFGAKHVLGMLCGAVAGAGLAYTILHSTDHTRPPPVQRRASYDHHLPIPASTSSPIGMPRAKTWDVKEEVEGRARVVPSRSYLGVGEREEPQYVQQYSTTPVRILEGSPLGRIEERPRRGGRERSRSEAGVPRVGVERELVIRKREDSPRGSYVSHRSHRSHRSHDTESYVSSRSPRGERGSQYKGAQSTTTITVLPSREKDGHGERRSVVVAGIPPIPLSTPRHRVREVEAIGWGEGYGGPPKSASAGARYAQSVAPSDSVSSVGSKRERERLRDRMRERW
jgi:hypothetical protein